MKQTRRSTNTLLAIVTAILFATAELPSLLFAAAAPKTDGQGEWDKVVAGALAKAGKK